jgi:hypothetical protein
MAVRSRAGAWWRNLTLALALAAPFGCHDRPEAEASRPAVPSREQVEPAPSASASGSGDATPDPLVREVLAAMEGTPLAGKFHYETGPFELVAAGGRVSLGNLRRELEAAPASERSARIQRFVRALNEPKTPPDFATARADVLPVVRDRYFFEQLPLMRRPNGLTAAFQVVGENLAIAAAIDHPDGIATIAGETLAGWNTGLDQVMEVARENLRKRSAAPFASVAPGVCASTWNDDYDGARMLLPDVLARCRVKGDLVVAVPNRSLLLVTGADDPQALAAFADRLEEGAKAPRANATRAFRFTAGAWAPFSPKGPPELKRRFDHFELRARMGDYEEQRKLLQDKLLGEGKDIFVAKFVVFGDKGGEAWSVATWARGVTTYLPLSDSVILGDPSLPRDKSILGRYALKDLRRVVPASVLRPLGLWPERLATDGFPTAEQLAKLKKLAD